MKRLSILVFALVLSGCATYEPAPTEYQLQNAYYGERPTQEEVKTMIDQLGHATLKDPFSAQYTYQPPRKAWTYYQYKVWYGYAIEYKVNAKNSWGAYGGFEPRQFIYNNGVKTPAQYIQYAYDPDAESEWAKSVEVKKEE